MALPMPFIEKDSYTEDEYFAFEPTSFGRWEYVRGEIRAMAGGSDDHNTIAGNVLAVLKIVTVPRGYRVYGSDMKIHTGDGVNTFPDVAVVCGPRKYYRDRTDVVTNPVLLVEVLSESTQGYDRGEKFHHYKTIVSLTDYLILHLSEPRVQLYSRKNDHWEFREAAGPEGALYLPSIETTLALSDVYAQIEFDAQETT